MENRQNYPQNQATRFDDSLEYTRRNTPAETEWVKERYCEAAAKYVSDKEFRERVDGLYNSVMRRNKFHVKP